MTIWKFWQIKETGGVVMVALGMDRYNEEKKRWEVVREDITPRLSDIENEIASKHNDLVSIYGEMGVGKSYLASYLSYLKIQQGKKVIVLSPKTYPVGQEHDFFWIKKKYDVSKATPNPFLPERMGALVNSLQVCFIAKIKSVGITAMNIRPLLDEIIKKNPKNWEDVHRIIGSMKKSQQSLSMALDTIENIVSQVALPINEEAINFDESCLLEFGGFGENADIQKAFYMELMSNIIFQKEQGRKERDFVLCVDEAHYLLKYAEAGSCLNSILRMGRLAFSLIICTQHLSDVHKDLRQTGSSFEFYTTHEDTSTYLKNVNPFMKDCVGLLRKNEFVDLKQEVNSKERVGVILKIDDFRFEEFLENARSQEWEETPQVSVVITPDNKETQENTLERNDKAEENVVEQKIENKPVIFVPSVTQQKPKITKEEMEQKIIEIVKASDFGLYAGQIIKTLGFDGANRANVDKKIKAMARDGKIRLMLYVEEGLKPHQKPRKIYYLNLQNEETQIHRRGIRDCKQICEKLGEKIIGEYQFNQGWDIEISKCFCDFKTGHQHSMADDIRKLKENSKIVIFVCVNYDVKKHYETTLGYAEGVEGKYLVCCLNELGEILKNWEK